MAAKLSDSEYAVRHRAVNRVWAQRNRECRYGAGRVALTVWVAESTKARLLALAATENAPVAVVADCLLSAALPPATTVTGTSDPDTLPLFEPDPTGSSPVDLAVERHSALMMEVDQRANAGEKWRGDIAIALNEAGWWDKAGKALVYSRLNEQ